MRKDKYMTNGDLEQGRIMKKLEEVNNEQTAIKMLEYSIVGNYPNIYELKGEYNGKTLQELSKKSMQKAHMTDLKENEMKEGNEKNKNEKDIKNQKLKMILMIIFHFKRSYLYEE